MPPAVAKKAQRYNEVHGHTQKVPKKDVIQKPFRPRHNEFKPTANMGQLSVPPEDEPPIPSIPTEITTTQNPTEDNPSPDELPAILEVDHANHKIKPAGFLAEFKDVDKNCPDFVFPA